MTTICPGCHRAIGQTPHCATCRAHNDPNEHCYCPECDTDSYLTEQRDQEAYEREIHPPSSH